MAYNASNGTQPAYLRNLGSLNRKTSWFPGGVTTCTYPTSPFTAAVLPALSSFTMDVRFASSLSSAASRYAWGSLNVAAVGIDSSTGYARALVNCTPSAVILVGNTVVNDGAWHSIALEVVGGATSTFNLFVDGVKQATATGVYTPSGTAGAISISGLFQGYIEELRLSSVARYGGSNYTPATAIFSNSTSNVVCLHHMGTVSDDYTGLVDLPIMGTVTVSTAGSTDTIAYPAATAGTNAISGYSLYYGTTSNAETLLSTNAGAGSGTFTHATPPYNSNYFYYVVANDVSSNVSLPSNEVQTGFSQQGKNFILTNSGTTFVSSAVGFGQQIQSSTGSQYATASNTIGPMTDTFLPAGQAFTVEAVVTTLSTSSQQWARGSGLILGMDASGFPSATIGYPNTGTTLVVLTTNSTVINDGLRHNIALTCTPGAGAGSLCTFRLYVDGILNGTAQAVRVPNSATQYICGFQWPGQVDEMAVSQTVQYSANYTPATAPFLQNRSGQIFLAHFDGNLADSNGLLDLPMPPVASFASSSGTDTISYTAAVQGTNPIAGYALYVGLSSGGESGTPYATNSGSGSGFFTHPAGSITSPFYYYVKAYDNAATPNYSVPSNEVVNPASGQFVSASDSNIVYSPYNWSGNASGTGAAATAAVSGGQVTSFTVTNPGSGYSTAPSVTITGGSGTGASATAVLGGGQVVNSFVRTGGSGYSSSFSATITGGGGTGAAATVTAVGGVVTSISITNPGSGYTSVPSISFVPGGGTGATAFLGIGNFVVSSVTLNAGGSGYASAPSVAFTANQSYTSCNPGSYFRYMFTGIRSTLTFDLRTNALSYPRILVRIDGSAWSQYILSDLVNITPSNLANQEHLVEVVYQASSVSQDRFAQPVSGIVFTGLYIDQSGSMAAPRRRKYNVLIFGDSITEGFNTLVNLPVPYNTTFPADNTLAYSFNLGYLLDAEFGVVGFTGSGLTVPGYGNNVPALPISYAFYQAGRARSFTSPAQPDIVVYLEGQNDGTAGATANACQAALTTVITGIMAAAPTSRHLVLRPLLSNSGNNVVWTGLLAAVAAINSPLVTSFDTTGIFNDVTDSLDGVHPLASAAIGKIAPALAVATIAALNTVSSASGGANAYIS